MNKRKKFCKIVAIFLIISISITIFPNRNVIANSDSFTYILDEYNNAIIVGCYQDSGTITIPSTIDGHDVISIYDYAFKGKNFTNVIISEGITSIGDFAFMDCTQLASVELPNSLISIDSHAFCHCSNLTTITLPESLESISYNVFLNCTKLEHINFPSSLKSIGSSAFQESGIKEVEIPASMISISSRAFFLCESLTSVNVYSKNVTYESQVYEGCASNLKVYGYAGSTTQTYANENGLTFEELDGEPEKIPVESIQLDKTNIRFLFTGDSYAENVNATVNPENATDLTLDVAINNESVVTISDITATSSGANFKVIPISDGTAVITVKSASNSSVVAYCGIAVKDNAYPSVSSVSLNKSSLNLSVNSNEKLSAIVNVDDERYKDIIWTSSNDSVARVDSNGNVTAISAGTATITATSVSDETKTATCMVNVSSSGLTSIPVELVELNKDMLELNVDDTEILTAKVYPYNATNKELNWTSSDTSVATVDNTGKVTAVGVGDAIITVTTQDGSEKLATCTVTVTENPLDKVPNEIFVEMNEIDFYKNNVVQVIEEKIASILGDTKFLFRFDWGKLREGTVTVNDKSKNIKIVYLNSGDYNESDANYIKGLIEKTNFELEYEYTVNENGEIIDMPSTDLENILGVDDVQAVILSAGPFEYDTGFRYDLDWYFFKNNVYYGGTIGSETFTKKIVESDVKVEDVSINKATTIIELEKTEMLVATVTPNNATSKEVKWTSSDTSVATVDNTGKVTAVGVGNAIITVSSTDGSNKIDSCNVTVIVPEVSVSSVELNKTAINLTEGDTETLTATVAPNNATNKEVNWTSSNTSVAAVDNTGKVTAVGVGNAIITVSSTDGSNKIDSCNVIVTAREVLVTSVELDKTEVNLIKGNIVALIATVSPNNATNKELNWTSSDTSVATVDNTGKITTVNDGTCIIEVSLKNNPKIKAQCQIVVSEYIKGDVDFNGIINGTDASMVLDKYNKNNATKDDLLVCDMDGDGIINGTDASMILDIYNKVL